MAIKVIKESTVNVAKLKFNSNSDIERAYDELFDLTYNGIEVYPNYDELPTPWDADISIKNNKIVLSGNVTPGGPSDGSCVVSVPLNSDLYKFEISYEQDNIKEVMNLLKSCNVDME